MVVTKISGITTSGNASFGIELYEFIPAKKIIAVITRTVALLFIAQFESAFSLCSII